MKVYIAQRLGIAVLTLFGMSVVIFVLLRLAPGDIVDVLFSAAGHHPRPGVVAGLDPAAHLREPPREPVAARRAVPAARAGRRHVLPNTMGPFIVLSTAQLGAAILTEAALSFLGLGVSEPYPSWGRMLSVSAAEYAQKAPRLVLSPGMAISLAVFGSNLFGDALRDTPDPRLRGA